MSTEQDYGSGPDGDGRPCPYCDKRSCDGYCPGGLEARREANRAATVQQTLPYSEPTTSRAAAIAKEPTAASDRGRVLGFLQGRGQAGATRDEIADGAGINRDSVRPRVWELIGANLAHEVPGKTRPTDSGNQAKIVYAGPDPNPKPADDSKEPVTSEWLFGLGWTDDAGNPRHSSGIWFYEWEYGPRFHLGNYEAIADTRLQARALFALLELQLDERADV